MATKNVSIRLAAVGGKQVKSELDGIGNAGKRGFDKVERGSKRANAQMAKFARRARIAARVMAAAAVTAAAAMVRSGLQTIDTQAKLAASLNTTTESVQVLTRAADLAGVSQGEVSQATIMMTKSLSQAAQGTGPAVKALEQLHLSAADLAKLPIDQKMIKIQDAIAKFIPKAQQAAVASQIFGARAGLIFTRIDSATLRQATQDVADFGVAVSEQDATQVQRTNDALSRMGLLWRGISNQMAVAAAPALEAIADAMAAIGKTTGPLGRAIKVLFDHIGEIATIAATFAAVLAGRLVASLALAALGIGKVTLSLKVLRGALVRTGIGALIVVAGELIYQFGRLANGAGGFGKAFALVGDVFSEIGGRIGTVISSLGTMFTGLGMIIKSSFQIAFEWVKGAINDYIVIPFSNAVNKVIDVANSLGGGFDRVNVPNASGGRGLLRSGGAGLSGADYITGGMNNIRTAMTGPLESVSKLGEAMTKTGDDGAAALDNAAAAADNVAAATSGAGKAAKKAGEEAATGWTGVAKSLKDYANQAADVAKGVGGSLTSAFSSAESAVGQFVKTGKFSFRDLTTSILADMAKIAVKKAILGPLAGFFGNIFSSVFPAKVNHAGGMAGTGPTRRVPALAFAGAPRMHSGGFAGLRPDEVPAILQRGERVLSRREVANGAGGAVDVSISVAGDGSIVPVIERVSGNIAARAVQAGMAVQDRKFPAQVSGYTARQG